MTTHFIIPSPHPAPRNLVTSFPQKYANLTCLKLHTLQTYTNFRPVVRRTWNIVSRSLKCRPHLPASSKLFFLKITNLHCFPFLTSEMNYWSVKQFKRISLTSNADDRCQRLQGKVCLYVQVWLRHAHWRCLNGKAPALFVGLCVSSFIFPSPPRRSSPSKCVYMENFLLFQPISRVVNSEISFGRAGPSRISVVICPGYAPRICIVWAPIEFVGRRPWCRGLGWAQN